MSDIVNSNAEETIQDQFFGIKNDVVSEAASIK